MKKEQTSKVIMFPTRSEGKGDLIHDIMNRVVKDHPEMIDGETAAQVERNIRNDWLTSD